MEAVNLNDFRFYADILDHRADKYDTIYDLSVDLGRHSETIVRNLHRVPGMSTTERSNALQHGAATLLMLRATRVVAIAALLEEEPRHLYSCVFAGGMEKLLSALLFFSFLKRGSLMGFQEAKLFIIQTPRVVLDCNKEANDKLDQYHSKSEDASCEGREAENIGQLTGNEVDGNTTTAETDEKPRQGTELGYSEVDGNTISAETDEKPRQGTELGYSEVDGNSSSKITIEEPLTGSSGSDAWSDPIRRVAVDVDTASADIKNDKSTEAISSSEDVDPMCSTYTTFCRKYYNIKPEKMPVFNDLKDCVASDIHEKQTDSQMSKYSDASTQSDGSSSPNITIDVFGNVIECPPRSQHLPYQLATYEIYVKALTDVSEELTRYHANSMAAGEWQRCAGVVRCMRQLKAGYVSLERRVPKDLARRKTLHERNLAKLEKISYNLRLQRNAIPPQDLRSYLVKTLALL